jgi:hypothetical protein
MLSGLSSRLNTGGERPTLCEVLNFRVPDPWFEGYGFSFGFSMEQEIGQMMASEVSD